MFCPNDTFCCIFAYRNRCYGNGYYDKTYRYEVF